MLPNADPKWGGTSVAVPTLCKAMYARDRSVRFYFAADRIEHDWPAFYEPQLKSRPAWFHRSRALQQALRNGDFAVIHHHALWLPSLGYAYEGAKRKGCPFVISPNGMLSAYALTRARIKKWLARRFLHHGAMRGATAWHATSEDEFRDIRAAGFKQPVTVIPNGITVPKWNEATDRAQWLEHCPELEGKRVFLFYSRLHSVKGVFHLLEMWARLAKRHPGWHLLMSGIPHEYTLDEVLEFTRSLRLAQRVTVADPRGLAKPYPLAELFVLPTRTENFGLVIGEALSVGVPVLTGTKAPWGKVNALECGACVPLEQFEAALDRMLSQNAETLRRMGRAGKTWVRSTFSWERVANEMLQFYHGLGGS